MKIIFGTNLFIKECLLYVPTLALGFVVSYNYGKFFFGTEFPVSKSYGLKDVIIIAICIALLLLIQKNQKISKWFYRIFLVIFIYGGAQIVGNIFIDYPGSILFGLFVILIFAFWRNVMTHDVAMIIAISGIIPLIGMGLSPKIAIIALIVLSFYDIIAVYKTKHMVAMARNMIASGAPFGFVVPIYWSGFLANRNEIEPKIGDKFMLLGAGDVGLPLLLISSVTIYSIWAGVVVGVFAMLGVYITHLLFINQEKREPMAALPPIATFTIIGYLVVTLLS
jgi:presenilin-like A22 family membrane protease